MVATTQPHNLNRSSSANKPYLDGYLGPDTMAGELGATPHKPAARVPHLAYRVWTNFFQRTAIVPGHNTTFDSQNLGIQALSKRRHGRSLNITFPYLKQMSALHITYPTSDLTAEVEVRS